MRRHYKTTSHRKSRGRRLLSIAPAMAIGLVLGWVAAAPSPAATRAQVARQLLAWHLHPAPLYPARLPSPFQGAAVTLSHQGFDYNIDFQQGAPPGARPGSFLVSLRRGPSSDLSSVIHDSRNITVQKVRVGGRTVYAFQGNKIGYAWHEQGRTYLIIGKYDVTLPTLALLVKALRLLG